jgi:hypothetical protein
MKINYIYFFKYFKINRNLIIWYSKVKWILASKSVKYSQMRSNFDIKPTQNIPQQKLTRCDTRFFKDPSFHLYVQTRHHNINDLTHSKLQLLQKNCLILKILFVPLMNVGSSPILEKVSGVCFIELAVNLFLNINLSYISLLCKPSNLLLHLHFRFQIILFSLCGFIWWAYSYLTFREYHNFTHVSLSHSPS